MKILGKKINKQLLKGLFIEYLVIGIPWRDRLGVFHNRYQQGNSRINIFKDVLIILGIGGLVAGMDLSFLPFWAFVVLGILWLIGCYTIGFIDEKVGFWKEQIKQGILRVDLVHQEMRENLKFIKELCQQEFINIKKDIKDFHFLKNGKEK